MCVLKFEFLTVKTLYAPWATFSLLFNFNLLFNHLHLQSHKLIRFSFSLFLILIVINSRQN